MRILSKKEVDEILKRITACQIMVDNSVISKNMDVDTFSQMTNNLADITVIVGGPKGAGKVLNTLKLYDNKSENHHGD